MLKPIFAANWKMNHGPTEARAFVRAFLAAAPRGNGRTLAFFPPAITLPSVVHAFRDRPEVLVGVQNIHDQPAGAFTGETSAGMARDAASTRTVTARPPEPSGSGRSSGPVPIVASCARVVANRK